VTILYIHSASVIGGANQVLLSLLDGLDRSRFNPVSIIPERGPLERELRRIEVPYVVLDLRPNGRPKVALLWAICRLMMICLKYRVDVVHANDPRSYRISSIGVRHPRVARLCHIHHPGETADSLRWALKRRPRLILTPSRFMKRSLLGSLVGVAGIPVEDVWNPIDLDWFRPATDVAALRASIGINPSGKHISILATLAPHKGHMCFLRMAELITKRFGDAEFHIVGRAQAGHEEYPELLQRHARELGIADRIRFWGFVDGGLARDLLCASDLFVLPTREEGFCLSVAEAQACQVPVLTSAIQPLDEVVDEGRTGYLTRPDDYLGFAARAIELLESEDLRRSMALAGRAWVLSRFSRQVYVDKVQNLYAKAVAFGA
jgi:L-malate glycosyltransferase